MHTTITAHLMRDEKLAEIIPHIDLHSIDVHNDIYLDSLDSIVSQQLSVKVAGIIFQRFLQIFPDANPSPENILFEDKETLRACGLSYQKVGYIQNIAQYWIDNKATDLPWLTMSDEEIIETLSKIKGVGKWTVQMILMFRLGRADIFPFDDLGVRQGMIGLYGLESKGKTLIAEMTVIAESWKPYRSTACRYVWKWKDAQLAKGKKQLTNR